MCFNAACQTAQAQCQQGARTSHATPASNLVLTLASDEVHGLSSGGGVGGRDVESPHHAVAAACKRASQFRLPCHACCDLTSEPAPHRCTLWRLHQQQQAAIPWELPSSALAHMCTLCNPKGLPACACCTIQMVCPHICSPEATMPEEPRNCAVMKPLVSLSAAVGGGGKQQQQSQLSRR